MPEASPSYALVRCRGLATEDEFRRDESGLTELTRATRSREVVCGSVRWDQRASADEWWNGPASGAAFGGRTVRSRTAEAHADIKRHVDPFGVDVGGPPRGVPAAGHRPSLGQAGRTLP